MSIDICNYEWSGCTTQNAYFVDIDSLYSDLLRSSEYMCLESVQAAFCPFTLARINWLIPFLARFGPIRAGRFQNSALKCLFFTENSC